MLATTHSNLNLARALGQMGVKRGDLVRMDADGFFYIVDRKDDLIITSGFNVYPSDVETALIKRDGVRDAGVVGFPDNIRGESIVAFVVMEEGRT